MTSMLSRPRGRHTRALAAAGAAFALVALSACEKPTPMTTVTVGSDSVYAEAACYNDGKKLTEESFATCVEDAKEAPSISIDRNDSIKVGVEPDVAERGWQIWLEGQPFDAFADSTYQSVDASIIVQALQRGGQEVDSVNMSIVETPLPDAGEQQAQPGYYGVWNFELELSE
ncbi:DUF2771 domain-containing protein [Streptomyces sp. GSL17-111]|uniref:DUF2771 domain-containing protein n=1 Tax=Streptomyces sp. GSL17-111 TaxID=3121596 RepID=UPI0030F45D36